MYRRLKNKLYKAQQVALDARASVELSKLGLQYLSWPESAIAPSGLITILNDIDINSRRTVLEFGSGVSTLYIAQILKQRGGRLISIDQDAKWSNMVKSWAEDADLQEAICLVVAPLDRCSHAIGGLKWYNTEIVLESIGDWKIDCLLVDGPAAYEGGQDLVRYPALPVAHELLNEQCSVFLDDIYRTGERKVVDRWSTQFKLNFNLLKGRGGLAYATRGKAFYAIM